MWCVPRKRWFNGKILTAGEAIAIIIRLNDHVVININFKSPGLIYPFEEGSEPKF